MLQSSVWSAFNTEVEDPRQWTETLKLLMAVEMTEADLDELMDYCQSTTCRQQKLVARLAICAIVLVGDLAEAGMPDPCRN